jgi:hypothetical protein
MKLEFSRQNFEKYSDVTFRKKIRPVGAELSTWTDSQPDRHDETKQSLFAMLRTPQRFITHRH